MSLTALQKISLGRQLNGAVQDAQNATGLSKITLGRQINALLLQLGYGTQPATEAQQPQAHPETSAEPPVPDEVSKPEIVTAFLKGDYVNLGSDEFTKTLTKLEPYLNVFLTLDDVVAGSSVWLEENYPHAA